MTVVHDPVSHPAHYTRAIEVIDFIETYELGYHLGNTVKYIARHADKGDPLEDLRKARWYLDREIARRAGHPVDLTALAQDLGLLCVHDERPDLCAECQD